MDKTNICNMAIGFCGGNPIMDFSEDSVEADLCRQLYEPTRDLVLEGRDWTFASARDSLTPLSESPAFGYEYRFQLPVDLLVVRKISDDPTTFRPIDFEKEQRTILANVPLIYIKYTIRVENEQLFSPSFVYALAHKLASAFAIPLTQSRTLKNDMEQIGQAYIDEGGSVDGTQSKVSQTRATKVVGARFRR